MKSLVMILLIPVLVFGVVSLSYGTEKAERAEIQELLKVTKELKQRIERLEKKLQQYEAKEKDIDETKKEMESLKKETAELARIKEALGHIELSGGVTGVVQGTLNNEDNLPNHENSTDAAFTMDLNLATHFGKYGNFYIHLEGGDGEGLNDDVASFSVPNYDAYATADHNRQADLTISEAFYEFNIFQDRLTFDAGKMDISVLFDENNAAGDETTQFLSNIFVKSMGLTIPEPDDFYCPAFMIRLAPTNLMEFRVIGASVEGINDSDWEDIFDHGFLAWQVNFSPRIKNRQGNYRFYGWWDDRNHLDNNDLAIANANPDYKDSLADKSQMGWGFSFDQEITDGIMAFVRYSQTEDDLARWNGDENQWEMIPFDKLFTAGLQLSGSIWNRDNDAIGIAYGQTFLTNDYENANTHTADEHYLETYYRLALHERFAITGDVQWINNAGGNSEADDIYILGLRTQIDF